MMDEPSQTAWRRLTVALKPRRTQAQAAIGVLFVLLGLGLALQVRSNAQFDGLSTAREADLVGILDDLTARNERLAAEESDLQATKDQLTSGTDQTTTALQEARRRADTLGILTGTVPAIGPGIAVTITDSQGKVDAAALLDTIEELRDAGAEALQIGSVRVVASTSFLDGKPGSVVVDGTTLRPPYSIVAIGDPRTISAALRIPGGVVETLRGLGGDATIVEATNETVRALRPASTPQYAQPASTP
jgi:uncharacterized protein YlxW (UPF0749 family)